MAHATITVEVLPDDTAGERLLHFLHETLSEHCGGIAYSVVRKESFKIGRSFDEGVALTVEGVRATGKSANSSGAGRWAVYLSPRKMEFLSDGEVQTTLSTVLMAIALGGRPVGIFLQTITLQNTDVPEPVVSTLYHRMEEARSRHIRHVVSKNDAEMLQGFTEAIGAAYERAFSPRAHQ